MASEKPEKTKGHFASKKIILSSAVGLVAAVVIGGAIYFFIQYQSTQAAMNDPQKANAQQAKNVEEEVSKLIDLPQNEKPQIATVSDVNKLKDQPFFAKAKNGHIVLIYTGAQKAILYDPGQNKIIEVGPINITQTTPTVSQAPVAIKVALYNGTSINGLSSNTEKELKTKLPNVTVVSKANAQKNTYAKTIVVDISGKQAAGAAQVAKSLNGVVEQLPAGEAKPTNADIVVILGRE